jgi:hypothetical protein
MKTLQTVFVVMALLVVTGAARAERTPDPKILIAGAGYSQVLTSPLFSFTATSGGGGGFDFENASGLNWEALTLALSMPYGLVGGSWTPLNSPEFYDIASDLFVSNSIDFGPNDLTLRFWGVDDSHPGIPTVFGGHDPGFRDDEPEPPGSHFFVNLDDSPSNPDVGGWLGENHDPLTFQATGSVTPIPEPASGLLLLGGVLALGLGGRRRRAQSRRKT